MPSTTSKYIYNSNWSDSTITWTTDDSKPDTSGKFYFEVTHDGSGNRVAKIQPEYFMYTGKYDMAGYQKSKQSKGNSEFSTPLLKQLFAIDNSNELFGHAFGLVSTRMVFSHEDAMAFASRGITTAGRGPVELDTFLHSVFSSVLVYDAIDLFESFMHKANFIRESVSLLKENHRSLLIVAEESVPQEDVMQILHFAGMKNIYRPKHVELELPTLLICNYYED